MILRKLRLISFDVWFYFQICGTFFQLHLTDVQLVTRQSKLLSRSAVAIQGPRDTDLGLVTPA